MGRHDVARIGEHPKIITGHGGGAHRAVRWMKQLKAFFDVHFRLETQLKGAKHVRLKMIINSKKRFLLLLAERPEHLCNVLEKNNGDNVGKLTCDGSLEAKFRRGETG